MRRDVRNPLLAGLACLLLLAPVVVVAYWVGAGQHLDAAILRRLAIHDGGPVHAAAAAVAALGEPLALLAILALLVALGCAAGRSREAVAAAAIVVGANVTTQVLKALLSHPRLQEELAGYGRPWPDAFPSGHTTAAASLAVALLFVVPPRFRPDAALAGAVFTGAMGVSVVLLSWHYPSDVLGALLVVASWACAAIAALRLLSPPRRQGRTARDRGEAASRDRGAVSAPRDRGASSRHGPGRREPGSGEFVASLR